MSGLAKTPTCPCCAAKFQHDPALERCRVCLLPDDAIGDHNKVAKWKRRLAHEERLKTRQPRRKRGHGRPRGTVRR